MSGHSKWATIKRKKGKADDARGRAFTKLIKEIVVAARAGGGDPDSNSHLRTVIDKAKSANMPVENVTRAIKRGTGELEGVTYEEVHYEGYGAGGVAVLVEGLTDNKNRTISDVRHIFTKNAGTIAENGAVGWVFESMGLITVDKSVDEETVFMTAIEAGAEDVDTEGEEYEITCPLSEFEAVKKAMTDAGFEMTTSEPTRLPSNTVKIEGKQAEQVLRLIDALEENDDIQKVYANFDIDMEEMAALMEE